MDLDSENKRGLMVGIPLVLIITAILVVGVIYFVDMSGKKFTATAPAEIVSAEPTSWNEQKTTKSGFRVSYRYTVNGKTISGVDEKNTAYKPGEQFRVCYDPKNPSYRQLRSSGGKDCGKGILF